MSQEYQIGKDVAALEERLATLEKLLDTSLVTDLSDPVEWSCC